MKPYYQGDLRDRTKKQIKEDNKRLAAHVRYMIWKRIFPSLYKNKPNPFINRDRLKKEMQRQTRDINR